MIWLVVILVVRIAILDAGHGKTMIWTVFRIHPRLVVGDRLLTGKAGHRGLAVELEELVNPSFLILRSFVRVNQLHQNPSQLAGRGPYPLQARVLVPFDVAPSAPGVSEVRRRRVDEVDRDQTLAISDDSIAQVDLERSVIAPTHIISGLDTLEADRAVELVE